MHQMITHHASLIYCYGVASLAAREYREYSLYRLAHLRGPALHQDINRWRDELVNGKGG
jgi:hypothetical protein